VCRGAGSVNLRGTRSIKRNQAQSKKTKETGVELTEYGGVRSKTT